MEFTDFFRFFSVEMQQEISQDELDALTESSKQVFKKAINSISKELNFSMRTLASAGVPIVLIGNCTSEVAVLIRESKIAKYFAGFSFSCELVGAKSSLSIFQNAIQKTGVSASKIIYIGDGGNNELNMIRSFGMNPFLVREYSKMAESDTGHWKTIDSASQALDLFYYLNVGVEE